ncbi:MAG: cellulase family glycosylhydrolase [Spirochaetes bacterium]|nr:cellulase family glycosylhydrolase [Spirochaetota bacterium]
MNKLCALLIMAAVSFGAGVTDIPRLQPIPNTPDISKSSWTPAGGCSTTNTVDGRIVLTTEVPAEQAKGHHWFETTLDLKPYRGKTVTFFVRYRTLNVSKPPQDYNGVKFMLTYKNGEKGTQQYPAAKAPFGTSDGWQDTAFNVTFGSEVTTGILSLGLQESSGKIEFILDSLQTGYVFSPEGRINLEYKITYPDNILNHKRQRGFMSPRTITTNDVDTLRSWNVNLMRWQITRNWGKIGTETDLDEYDTWLKGKLDDLDKAISLLKPAGIKVVIDLHSPPGGKVSAHNMRMFFDKKYADHFIKVWQTIAKRYKGNPGVYAYDLVNEPVQTMPAPFDYWNLQRMAAEAIREIDPDTPIMLESNESDRPQTYAYMSALRMNNIIYKVHMYFPLSYTHQGVFSTGAFTKMPYPGLLEGEQWDKEKIRKTLQPVRDFQLRHTAKIYVGEFSAIAYAPGAEKYINDCIEIFEEYGWDWTFHAFREFAGWSVEHDGPDVQHLAPAPDTLRKQVLLKYFKLNEK